MRRLVIDSATEACSVALFEGDILLAGEFALLGRGHAERLVPMISALPGHGRAGEILVNAGPGSFTGIRVGLAAAKALAMAWGAQLLGYQTHDLLAAMARAARGGVSLTAVTTGGHGEWFVRPYGADGAALAEVASLTPEQACASQTSGLAVGSQAEALIARAGQGEFLDLRPDAREAHLLPESALFPAPSPVYGRAPDARLPAA